MVNRCEAAARLERKSFFAHTRVLFNVESLCKKDWEWKAEIAAQIFLFIKNNGENILIVRNRTVGNLRFVVFQYTFDDTQTKARTGFVL